MTAKNPNLLGADKEIERLLADPANGTNPLREPLQRLYADSRERLDRLDRLTRISDGYQSMALHKTRSLTERYQKQLRQLEKLTRISDRYQQLMRELNQALEQASTHDPLTALPNRRALMRRLREECERSTRYQQPLVVALADIDRFKDINDLHGHDIGDEVLISVSTRLHEALRQYDYCGRWGGEEFMLILPQTGVNEAEHVLDRLREQIAGTPHRCGEIALATSISIGMTAYHAGEPPDTAIKRADDALLSAKRSGRNRRLTG